MREMAGPRVFRSLSHRYVETILEETSNPLHHLEKFAEFLEAYLPATHHNRTWFHQRNGTDTRH